MSTWTRPTSTSSSRRRSVRRARGEWEDRFLPEGVAVVAVSPYGFDRTFVVSEIADELGLRAQSFHPNFDEYPRASEYVRFAAQPIGARRRAVVRPGHRRASSRSSLAGRASGRSRLNDRSPQSSRDRGLRLRSLRQAGRDTEKGHLRLVIEAVAAACAGAGSRRRRRRVQLVLHADRPARAVRSVRGEAPPLHRADLGWRRRVDVRRVSRTRRWPSPPGRPTTSSCTR